MDVFFDDFKVVHTKSPVVQQEEYYPFGLKTSNSYSRENSLPNRFTYNGKEEQDELDLGWLDYGARMYQPELGRFSTMDPHSDSYFGWTPYNYVANNPVLLVDPDGRDWVVNKTEKDGKTNYDITFQAALVNNSKNVTTEDIVNLAVNLSNQIQDAFTIDEDGVTTSVNVELRVAKDGKVKDNEHVINVTDDLDSDEAGEADIGGREIKINSAQVWQMNGGGKDNDKTTGPHEAGHTAGLVHPDEISWLNMWSWGDRDQIIPEGTDNDNLMYSGPYRQYTLEQNLNNGGKGYKINGNQAEIIYQNRDNKPKKKN